MKLAAHLVLMLDVQPSQMKGMMRMYFLDPYTLPFQLDMLLAKRRAYLACSVPLDSQGCRPESSRRIRHLRQQAATNL
ncbi:hypothetical protein [Burkholderia gladioli]|uniref:hypothetical protein n=1 Tax=Burkholderia gladioli TaxID=28095 RepID=UPI00105753B6|nr:hypothetical protein [Burkholderia gladioli]